VELLGKVRDRSVGTSQLLENAASGGIRERGERGIEAVRRLNHMVQYSAYGGGMQGVFSTAVVPEGALLFSEKTDVRAAARRPIEDPSQDGNRTPWYVRH
jgi:hypothetical protein